MWVKPDYNIVTSAVEHSYRTIRIMTKECTEIQSDFIKTSRFLCQSCYETARCDWTVQISQPTRAGHPEGVAKRSSAKGCVVWEILFDFGGIFWWLVVNARYLDEVCIFFSGPFSMRKILDIDLYFWVGYACCYRGFVKFTFFKILDLTVSVQICARWQMSKNSKNVLLYEDLVGNFVHARLYDKDHPEWQRCKV